MTLKQVMIKAIYPIFVFINKLLKKHMQAGSSDIKARTSFYDLKMKQNNGHVLDFQTLKNKKILLVNTASACGFTPQYDGLQKLYEENKENLVVLGFPSNDFGEQEKGDDTAIDQFCKINFGVTFPLMSKSTVVKNNEQNEVFKWLSDKEKNGWNDKAPTWNFCKYIIDENGDLTHFFGASIEPADDKVLQAIK